MTRREELKQLKEYLSRELSRRYNLSANGKNVATEFENNDKIKIAERRHSGDLTRDVYYKTEDFDNFIGYVSYCKDRGKDVKRKDLLYAVSIADGTGIEFYKTLDSAAKNFSSKCLSKIEEVIWDYEHRPKEKPHVSKIDPAILHEDHEHI